MSVELSVLEAAAGDFLRQADPELIDARRLSALIDGLQGKLCQVVAAAQRRGEHLLSGQSACSWVASECQMSKSAAADRLCVGEELRHLPRIAEALSSGEIGYQAAAVICHLSQQVGEKREYIEEEDWIGFARRFAIKELRYLSSEARIRWDCEGFERESEESFERRSLDLSETQGGMFRLDGWLDPAGGAALKTAIDALARPLGGDEGRSPRQRRADALVEMAHHALDQGTLPRRHGMRPHLSVNTTIEGLKGELGAAASTLQNGMPISRQTVQRLACDASLHRVLKADSLVVDVGRAWRSAQPAQWRALRARYRSCAWPGCDRPLGWTHAHHLEFWARGGATDLPKLLPLCFHHHRLVHEGGWQVVQAGQGYRFVPPDRPALTKRRWGERRWAA
jgi:hypothetical protein